MALLLIEGFDAFGTTLDAAPQPTGVVTRKHPATYVETNMRVAQGRLGGYALRLAGYDSYVSPGNITTDPTLIVGFAYYPELVWYGRMLAFYDGSTLGMNVQRKNDGSVAVYRGGTLLAASSPGVLPATAWRYIEFKTTCNDTTGSYELRIGGVTVLSDTGVDTRAGANDYHTTFRLRGLSNNYSYSVVVDDLWCCDGSGAVNNDFLGDRRVVTIHPDLAGDSAQWTPSAGDNHTCVDEEVANDDTDYVESSTTDEKDLYNYESLTGLSSINGLQISTDCRETDAQTFSVKTVCKSGSVESDDAAQTIGSIDYVTRGRVLETDPDTASAWTDSGVNAAQFGVKVG